MCKFGPVVVGFIVEEEDTPTAKDYAFQILETVEQFKQEIFNKTNIIKKVPPLFLKVRFLQVVVNKPKHYALNERGGIKMPPQTTPGAPPAPPCPPG